jgi:hypothetical protein
MTFRDRIKGLFGGKITPKQVVTTLCELMVAIPELSETKVLAAMDNTKIPHEMSLLAYHFTQIAWGRLYISNLGITFNNAYWCLDAAGEIVEQGPTADNPYFSAALEQAPKYRQSPIFEFMARTSSVVRTIEAALKNGSKPEKLLMTPDAIFIKPSTQAGLTKLNQLMTNYVDTHFKKRSS